MASAIPENDPGASQHRQRDEEQRFKKQREARAWLERVGEDIAVTEPPKPREVIPEILPCASTIVAGAGHEGKSVTLIFIAIRIALGLKIFGRETREGPVLYAFGEDSTTDVRRLVRVLKLRESRFQCARDIRATAGVNSFDEAECFLTSRFAELL